MFYVRYLSICALLLAPPSAVGQTISLDSTDSVVVLRNGFVLHGRVTPLGDHYLVMQGGDNQVRVPVNRVSMVCGSLDEAYSRQRDLCRPGDIRAHLRLARWCLQHHLVARAADQVLAVVALDPAHPQLAGLESRLRLTQSDSPERVGQDEQVVRASHQEIFKATNRLSLITVQQFTAGVQPFLINRCASNACHGSTSTSSFRLLRPSLGKQLTRRMTHRNLYAVVQQVDPAYPQQSRLLTATSMPHGGDDVPILGPTDREQREMLMAWVRSMNHGHAEAPTHVEERNSLLQNRSRGAPPREDLDNGPSETDPFDPEIFNRRHAAEIKDG
jgi:hypothetical protein